MKHLGLFGLAFGAVVALSAPASAQDITIGVAGPMTGQYASFGTQFKNGMDAAIADNQCLRRRARQEAQASDRRRRV